MHPKCPPEKHGTERNQSRECQSCKNLRQKDRVRELLASGRCPGHPKNRTVKGHMKCRRCLNYASAYGRTIRTAALAVISHAWGDDESRCRKDTLPIGHPLRNHECYGELQIDHINGDGAKAFRYWRGNNEFYLAINKGKVDITNLRVLCQLHQLWNWRRKRR